MNKKAKQINRAQNLLIILLTLSSLFLLTRTPLFGNLSDRPPRQIITELLGGTSSVADSTQTTLSSFSTPIQLLYTNDFTRFGQDAVTVLDGDFEAASAFLSEAIGSAASPVSADGSAFLSALQSPGIYVDFTVELPLSILNHSLSITSSIPSDNAIRRVLLSVQDGESAKLYLLDNSGACTIYTTDVKVSSVREFLSEQSGNGAYLCAQLPEEYNQLSPYTLILAEQTPRNTLSASNPLTQTDNTELLRAVGFNPHTENRYTESSGATVIREGDSSLRIDTNGVVTYQGGSAASDSPYFISASSTSLSAVEAVAAVQKLAATLLQNSIGTASLYVSEFERTASGYLLSLDYIVNGTPVCFSDGSHAVSATIKGQSITSLSVCFRTYTLTDSIASLLPLQQAFAIAESNYEGAKPSIYYVDTGADTVSPSWIAE